MEKIKSAYYSVDIQDACSGCYMPFRCQWTCRVSYFKCFLLFWHMILDKPFHCGYLHQFVKVYHPNSLNIHRSSKSINSVVSMRIAFLYFCVLREFEFLIMHIHQKVNPINKSNSTSVSSIIIELNFSMKKESEDWRTWWFWTKVTITTRASSPTPPEFWNKPQVRKGWR